MVIDVAVVVSVVVRGVPRSTSFSTLSLFSFVSLLWGLVVVVMAAAAAAAAVAAVAATAVVVVVVTAVGSVNRAIYESLHTPRSVEG